MPNIASCFLQLNAAPWLCLMQSTIACCPSARYLHFVAVPTASRQVRHRKCEHRLTLPWMFDLPIVKFLPCSQNAEHQMLHRWHPKRRHGIQPFSTMQLLAIHPGNNYRNSSSLDNGWKLWNPGPCRKSASLRSTPGANKVVHMFLHIFTDDVVPKLAQITSQAVQS